MNADLFNFHTRSPAYPSSTLSSTTSSASTPKEPQVPSESCQSSQYCHSWNHGCCRWPFGHCKFHHSFESLDRHHPSIHCPQRPFHRVNLAPNHRLGGGGAAPPSLALSIKPHLLYIVLLLLLLVLLLVSSVPVAFF